MGGISNRIDISKLERKCADFFIRRHAIALGCGTWVIALILEVLKNRVRNRVVALPSFICHTPLAAVIYAGWQPLFCDVDPATGLVPDSEWSKAAEMGAEAFIFVHLFGNPADIRATAELCRQKGVFLIEDACQALGALVDGRPCGSFGDASVLSFGHTKTIDAGSGGMLLTDDSELAFTVAELAASHEYLATQDFDAQSEEFSKLFYERKVQSLVQRNSTAQILSGLIEQCLSIVPARWEANACWIADRVDCLSALAAERRRKANIYMTLLRDTSIVPILMHKDAVPWRFCFRFPNISRNRQEFLSSALRAESVHVSNWYLPTHWMIHPHSLATGDLSGTLQISSEIFQLWLDDDTNDTRIHTNVSVLKKVLNT